MRNATTKANSKLITVWIPEAEIPNIDRGARKADLDRSKFIRNAIREKLQRIGGSPGVAQ